jgi:hypothetical protein
LLLARRGVRVRVDGALSGGVLVDPAACWDARAFPGYLLGGRCGCGTRLVVSGALPAGGPGRLATGCSLAIAALDGPGDLSVALITCLLSLVSLLVGLLGFPAALSSLISLRVGLVRGHFFGGGLSLLAGLLGVFLKAGAWLAVVLGAAERRGQRRPDRDEQYRSYSHQNVWCQQSPQDPSFVCNPRARLNHPRILLRILPEGDFVARKYYDHRVGRTICCW